MHDMTDSCGKRIKKWYCLRSKTRREHLVAIQVGQLQNVEIYCPRIRVRRTTVRGPVWFEEALFPGYLFARFDFELEFRQVTNSWGVTGIVHFGTHYATLADEVIETLRSYISGDEPLVIQHSLREGELVRIEEGPLRGLSAVVLRPLPAAARVRIMLEFMGSRIEAEMNEASLKPLENTSFNNKTLLQARR